VPFANADDLRRHYRKHRFEYSWKDRADYLAQGEAFLNSPLDRATTLEHVRPNGSRVRFNQITQEYGTARATGEIITYFIPDPAVHGEASNLDYFNIRG
jgi:filamentous hemagglutinin